MGTGNEWKSLLQRTCKYHKAVPTYPNAETINRITLLIEKFPSIKTDDRNNYTLLHYLPEINSNSTIQNLIIANFNVDIPNSKEKPIDRDEVMIEIIKMLIQGGIDINAKNIYGFTALHHAMFICNECVVDQLLNAGADPNLLDRKGNTPLHLSLLYKKEISLVKRLIDAGANVNALDSDGRNGVFRAAERASVESLNLLIDNGATINLIDHTGIQHRDLLRYALESWAYENLSVLIAKFGSENLHQFEYDLAIENAIGKYEIENQLECIEILFKQSMKMNHVIKCDFLLNDTVITFQHTKIIHALLRRGGIFNFKLLASLENSFIFKPQLIKIYTKYAAICNSYENVKGIVNFDYEKLNEEQKQYYEDCVKELQKLKNFVVYESMPLSNLIEGKVSSSYVLNQDLKQMFESGFIAKTYPICSDMLIERFEKEREKYELLLNATAGLQCLIKLNNYSIDLIYQNILKYLETKDQRVVASFTNSENSE